MKSLARRLAGRIPLLGWISGALVAVIVERLAGQVVAEHLCLAKAPLLFGCLIAFREPAMIPAALAYNLLVYCLPFFGFACSTTPLTNRVAAFLLGRSLPAAVVVHLALFYAALSLWAGMSPYRELTVCLMLIAIILTLSLNLINGYMGEFSCSHPGFMALGAYGASAFTLILFVDDRVFGAALLPAATGPWLFSVALLAGGIAAALGALVIAIPSFRTRGDYLAIISLAFMFIVKSILENSETLGGPRGLGGQPAFAGLPTVFAWTVFCVLVINNLVRSIPGKALNAVRDDEIAAEAMGIDTRRAKMTAFMLGAFWAGIAGGLYAHVMGHVTPASFDLRLLAEMLAMVYFGGLNSVGGSIFGAVSLSLLSEALRPLETIKWILIPLLLILVMIFRPSGLFAFRDFDPRRLMRPGE